MIPCSNLCLDGDIPPDGRVWVSIPLEQLEARIYELPPPGEPLHVSSKQPLPEWLSTRYQLVDSPVEPPASFEPGPGRLWRAVPLVEEFASQWGGLSVLDLGCGGGRNAVLLASKGAKVTAIDLLPDAIERARALELQYLGEGRVQWESGDLRSGLPTATFDLVLTSMYLPPATVDEVFACVNPGGKWVFHLGSGSEKYSFSRLRANLPNGLVVFSRPAGASRFEGWIEAPK